MTVRSGVILLFFLALGAIRANAQVPGNVLTRVLEIRFNDQIGTGFIVDYADRQYIVTADHLMAHAGSRARITYRAPPASEWHKMQVSVLHGSDACSDVAVLTPPESKLTTAEPVPIGNSSTYAISQEAYFLGFPFGLYTSFANSAVAGPLVKHAYISAVVACAAIERDGSQNEPVILLDGLNNPGFSGGPVVAADIFSPNHPLKFVGVIRGYRPEDLPLNTNGHPDPKSTVATNTGIMVVIPIERAIELLKKSNTSSDRPK